MKYTADFETTTIEPTNVWAWGICNIDNPDICYFGETISEFFTQVQQLSNPTLYFHNMKFDISYILHHLLTHNFIWRPDKKQCIGNDFSTTISDDGKFYTCDIYFEKLGKHVKKVTIYDSLKLLNFSIENIAKYFDLPIKKGKIDYDRHNTPCEVTDEEWDYLKNDVQIIAMALKQMFAEGFDKITIGSCALGDYKKFIGDKKFKYWFPVLDLQTDSEIRMSYKGGFTYANPEHINEDIGRGIVFDVNSLYPSVMHDKPLPYGVPVKFQGKYENNKTYPLFVQNIRCFFELKDGYLPTIQIKHSKFFAKTEYLTTSHGELVDLCLTSPDLELFLKHYNVKSLEYLGGYMFKSSTKLFAAWVDKWNAKKIRATIEGNKGKRQIAKLSLNNLYGKFSLNPLVASKYPYFDKNENKVKYKLIEYELCDENGNHLFDEKGEPRTTVKKLRDPIYIPVGTFITAWARYTTITASQAIHEQSKKLTGVSRYLYSDTDSIHLAGFEIPNCIDVHPTELGKWKHESSFTRARFIQAKRYIEDEIETDKDDNLLTDENGDYKTHLKITCAGMPQACYPFVTWDNFKLGNSFNGKLIPITVQGGIILVPTAFTLSGK